MDREAAIKADALSVFAKQARADRVKGPRPSDRIRYYTSAVSHDFGGNVLNAPLHLRCRTAREGQEHDAAWVRTMDDEIRDSMRKVWSYPSPRPR
jgi:hypothetical protein